MTSLHPPVVGWVAVYVLLSSGGCRADASFESPTPGFERMLEQPRYDAYEGVTIAGRIRSQMRLPPEGAVPYGTAPVSGPLLTGRRERGGFVRHFPLLLDENFVLQGRRDFGIFCAPCHGSWGEGNGPVAAYMNVKHPPSLHEPRLRALSIGELFAQTTNGSGIMPSYAKQLTPNERWAVVAYVRALQLSRHLKLASLPPNARERFRARMRGGRR